MVSGIIVLLIHFHHVHVLLWLLAGPAGLKLVPVVILEQVAIDAGARASPMDGRIVLAGYQAVAIAISLVLFHVIFHRNHGAFFGASTGGPAGARFSAILPVGLRDGERTANCAAATIVDARIATRHGIANTIETVLCERLIFHLAHRLPVELLQLHSNVLARLVPICGTNCPIERLPISRFIEPIRGA